MKTKYRTSAFGQRRLIHENSKNLRHRPTSAVHDCIKSLTVGPAMTYVSHGRPMAGRGWGGANGEGEQRRRGGIEMRSMGKGVESMGRGNMEKGGMNIEVAGMGKGGIWGGGTWDGGCGGGGGGDGTETYVKGA